MMDRHLTDQRDEPVSETPEDVAILYSWANLHGAKYRDFSASRREYRAQVRHRAAEELRQAELTAQARAEASATEAERRAREAERAIRDSERYEVDRYAGSNYERTGFAAPIDRERALQDADQAARRAAAERVEAARRAEAAAIAEAATRREEREIADAHTSAQRQAARWDESEVRRRNLAGRQTSYFPAQGGDPYEGAQGARESREVQAAPVEGRLHSPNRNLAGIQMDRPRMEQPAFDAGRSETAAAEALRLEALRSGERRVFRQPEPEVRRPRGFKPDQPSGIRAAFRSGATDASVRSRVNGAADQLGMASGVEPQPFPASPRAAAMRVGSLEGASQPSWPTASEPAAPAWLNPGGVQAQSRPGLPVVDSLQSSRERVASRWFALRGVFEAGIRTEHEPPAHGKEVRTPSLAVFSLAGGVGKTSMVAALGRALSSLGEKVLLADTTSHGLLPYYFGATELKSGVVRTFSPPDGSSDAAIHLVSYDLNPHPGPEMQDALAAGLASSAQGVQRLLVDFNPASGWLMRRMSRMAETVLVPLVPDMNSVISLQMIERYFDGLEDADGRALRPFYVLNQFDAALPLHLDVREVLRRRLGDRLLPYVVRRAEAVSEALAEGMTVVDYQPEGLVAEDYVNIAKWLRSVSAPATPEVRKTRWSER